MVFTPRTPQNKIPLGKTYFSRLTGLRSYLTVRRMKKKPSKDLLKLARTMRLCRQSAGMSQIALAEKLGVSNKQLCNIETAKNWPSMPLYIALCREFLNLGEGQVMIPFIPHDARK
jgi:DNA-binding XRE family transcriptional regulator